MRWTNDRTIRTYAALALFTGYGGAKVLISGHVRFMPVPQWVGILLSVLAAGYIVLIVRRIWSLSPTNPNDGSEKK